MVALMKPDNHIAQPQKSNEWYTPVKYIEAARQVMGSIDLDPASCELANQTVRAARYYTQENNGLMHPWRGKVWLNPPFGRQNAPSKGFGGGKSIMGIFVSKLVYEYEMENTSQAIALVTSKIDASWFSQLWQYPICFTTQRVLFDRPNQAREGHFFGTAFVYLGWNEQAFTEVFSKF